MERKKILIYLYAAIGDTITSLPAVRAILQKYRNDDIKIVVEYYNPNNFQLNILEELPEKAQVEFVRQYPLRSFRVLFERLKQCLRWRKEKFDIGYILILYGTPWRKRFAFRYVAGIKKLYCTDFFRKYDNVLHKSIVKQYEKFGFKFEECAKKLQYPFSKKHLQIADVFFNKLSLAQEKTPIAVGITAVTQNNFSWSQERYIELLKTIISEYNLYPLFFCAPHERENIMPVLKAIGTGEIISDFKAVDVMAIMSKCRFYLGNDTGTMHMADCAGIPCVTIFCNRDYFMAWSPEGEHHINIIHRQPCGECHLKVCKYGFPARCISEISVAEVAAAVDKIMTD